MTSDVEKSSTVYLINQGLHTGLALSSSAINEADKFTWLKLHTGMFLEFGYGDEYYYTHDDAGWIDGVSALFSPGPAVIHISAFNENPVEFFSGGTVYCLPVSSAAVTKIAEFITDSLILSPSGAPVVKGKGLYGDAAFYGARKPFSIMHNCNDWVLLALKAAGCDVSMPWIATSGSIERIGERAANVNPHCGK